MAFTRDINDTFIEFLNNRGFLPILQPTGGLVPPTIYLVDREHSLCMLHGFLNQMVPTRHALAVNQGPSSDLENLVASKADASVSVSFFERVLKLFGISGSAKLDAAAKAQDEAKFAFGNVKSLLVDPAAIESVLNMPGSEKGSSIGDGVRSRFKRTEFDEGLVHVAYEFLYSNKIELRVGASITSDVRVEATVTEVASAKLGVGAGKSSGAATLYDGKEPVAFAFRLAQILHEQDRYYVRATNKRGAGLSATDTAADPYIVETGRIFEIEP
jgi:hypothetical protein